MRAELTGWKPRTSRARLERVSSTAEPVSAQADTLTEDTPARGALERRAGNVSRGVAELCLFGARACRLRGLRQATS